MGMGSAGGHGCSRPWRATPARAAERGGDNEKEEENGEEGGEGRSGAQLWRSRALGSAWRRAWTRVSHGGARSGAWLPRRHFVEHVVRVVVLDLEAVIGMLAC